VALTLHVAFESINPLSYWGWSRMITPFLAYTLFAPIGNAWSWPSRRAARAGRRLACAGPIWPLRLLQIHVCTMYAEAGFARLASSSWTEGDSLLFALANQQFSRLVIDWVEVAPVLGVLSLVVFLLEPLAPFLLWVPRLGVVWALALIGMHVGLELLTRVGFWNFVMTAGLFTFLPPGWFAPSRGPSGSAAPSAVV